MDRRRLVELALNGLKKEMAELEGELAGVSQLGREMGKAATVKKIRRTGRKMTAAARKAVSRRMKAYWAKRKKR